MNVQVELTIRGVSYEDPRDRWRCCHRRSGKPILQLRFDNQYDAVWKKIELCADEGTFPFVKTVKQSDTTLPVGLRYGRYGPTARPFVGAILPCGGTSEFIPFYYDPNNTGSFIDAVKHALTLRFEHCMKRLINEVQHFKPIQKNIIARLERNVRERFEKELMSWVSSINPQCNNKHSKRYENELKIPMFTNSLLSSYIHDRCFFDKALSSGDMEAFILRRAKDPKAFTPSYCLNIAERFSSLKQWEFGDMESYYIALERGYLDEIKAKCFNIWTVDTCFSIAREYKTRNAWQKGHINSYQTALENNWIEECGKHFVHGDGIFSVEECFAISTEYNSLDDLTKNEELMLEVAKSYNIYKFCVAHFHNKKIPNKYILEKVLECFTVSDKYIYIRDFISHEPDIVKIVKKYGVYKYCVAHMHHKPKWNKENCKEAALKYFNIREWKEKSQSSYIAAKRNSWFNDCIKHMKSPSNPQYSLEDILMDAIKFDCFSDWKTNSVQLFRVAYIRGWLDKVSEVIMKLPFPSDDNIPRVPYTIMELINEAQKYQSRTEWRIKSIQTYSAAKKLNCYKQCVAHMVDPRIKTNTECAAT